MEGKFQKLPMIMGSLRGKDTDRWHVYLIAPGADRITNIGIYNSPERAAAVIDILQKVAPKLTNDDLTNRKYAQVEGMVYDHQPVRFPPEVEQQLLAEAREEWNGLQLEMEANKKLNINDEQKRVTLVEKLLELENQHKQLVVYLLQSKDEDNTEFFKKMQERARVQIQAASIVRELSKHYEEIERRYNV